MTRVAQQLAEAEVEAELARLELHDALMQLRPYSEAYVVAMEQVQQLSKLVEQEEDAEMSCANCKTAEDVVDGLCATCLHICFGETR